MKLFQKRNESFECLSCKKTVEKASKTSRNHCPFCLTSIHVDELVPGDRASLCEGIMSATAVIFNSTKSIYQLEFTCKKCRKIHRNKIADDDDAALIGQLIYETNVRQSQKNK